MKIFAMERELRLIKNRGYFLVPQLTPQDNKIETTWDKDKILATVDEIATTMLNAVKQSEETYIREQEQARARDKQLRSVRQTDRSDFNYLALANSTPIRNDNARSDQPGVHFNTNPVCHIYSTMSNGDNQYEPPVNDSIIQGAASAPTDQFATNTTSITGRNDPWRRNNGTNTVTNTAPLRMSTRPTGRNGLHNNSLPNSSDTRNGPTCFRCGEQGHMRLECRERVFCNNCKTFNHDMKACRKQHNNIQSPANSQITTGYHPTATPPPLMGTTSATQQAHQTVTHNRNPLFQNLLNNNQQRTSTMIHTLYNSASPSTPADIMEGITQIMTQVTNNNKRYDASKQMMKNIKIFNGSNKAECITWLSQVEAAARFTNTPFLKLICQSMVPAMLHVFSELSALASDEDIKDAILTNYSDIPSTTEATTQLQNIQISTNEPLVTFNHRYDRSSSRNNSFNSSQNSRSRYRGSSYPSSNDSYNRQSYNRDNSRNRGFQQQPRYEQRNQNYQNRYDNSQDRNRFDNRRRPNKYQHHRNQHKTQVIFEFSDQNMMEMMQTVRGFINLIKANPTTREQYKSNKLATHKYDNEVNKTEIQSSSLDQVQQFFNEDTD